MHAYKATHTHATAPILTHVKVFLAKLALRQFIISTLDFFLLISITNFTSLDENWLELNALKSPKKTTRKKQKNYKFENKKCNRKFLAIAFTHK